MIIIMDRTALEKWAVCPHQANLCLKNQYPINDSLPVGGVLVHDLIEQAFEKNRIKGTSAYELAKVAEEIVDSLPKVRPDLSQQVRESCKYVADVIAGLANIPIVGVEMQIEAVITPEELKEKLGYITDKTVVVTQCQDLVQYGRNSLHYRDWRTGYKKRTRQEAQDEFQSACGAWLLLRNYDGTRLTKDNQVLPRIDTIHVWYHEVRWRTTAYAKFERDHEDPAQPHLSTYKMLEYRVLSAVKLWLEGSDEAWPEPHKCGFCPAVKDCKLADYQIKEISDDPQKYIDKFVVINALYDSMYRALKKFHQGHGRIDGTEVAFDWKPAPSYRPKLFPKVIEGEPDNELEEHFQ